MSRYEIISYTDKCSIAWSLLIKKQILVKYFFLKVLAEVLTFCEAGASYINPEKKLVEIL